MESFISTRWLRDADCFRKCPSTTVDIECPKVDISKLQEMEAAKTKGLIIAFVYGICSASMAFANKAVLNSFEFDFPFTLVSCQMVFTIILLEALRTFDLITLAPFSIERGKSFIFPSLFYAIHSVLSLSALSGMNIPMYGVIKRCAPLVILMLGTVILKKGFPGPLVISSVALITSGCVVAGIGDIEFDIMAYSFGVAAVVSQALYLVLVQKSSQSLSATETLHLNSYNTLPMLLLCSVFFGEFREAAFSFDLTNFNFIFMFTLVISMGCLLNYMLFLCTTYNSALTTSITGTLKSIVQTAIGMFTFGGIDINLFTMSGIVMNLGGGVVYSIAKYRDGQKKMTKAKTSMLDLEQAGDSTENENVKLVVQNGFKHRDTPC